MLYKTLKFMSRLTEIFFWMCVGNASVKYQYEEQSHDFYWMALFVAITFLIINIKCFKRS